MRRFRESIVDYTWAVLLMPIYIVIILDLGIREGLENYRESRQIAREIRNSSRHSS